MRRPAGFDPSFLGVAASLPTVGTRPVVLLDYTHFTVQLDTDRALAACAAVNIDGARLVELPRTDDWKIDPRVSAAAQTAGGLYEDNRLDRGHLVRRRDPCWGSREVAQAANVDTFHYVNAAPQMAVFNQSKTLWLGLESYLLQAAAAAGARLSVLTGPVLAGDDPLYRDVAIPRRFYKLAAWADADGGQLAATGYVLDQSELLARIGIGSAPPVRQDRVPAGAGPDLQLELGAYRTYQVPITDVETLTGLDFGVITGADRLSAGTGQRAAARAAPAGWVELGTTGAIAV